MSLLQDVRRDVSPDLIKDLRRRYLEALPDLTAEAFDTSYAVIGAQRNTRILGTFTRLLLRDGKPGYLGFMPRTWRLLEGDLGSSGAIAGKGVVRRSHRHRRCGGRRNCRRSWCAAPD